MSKKQYGLLVLMALISGLVGGVVSSFLLMSKTWVVQQASQRAKVIQAERIELVDKAGKTRVRLNMEPYTTEEDLLKTYRPYLKEAQERFSKEELQKEGISEEDLHKEGFMESLVQKSLREDPKFAEALYKEIPRLAFFDEKGLARVSLDLTAQGHPSVRFFDEGTSNPRAMFALDTNPSLSLYDSKGGLRAELALWQEGYPRLGLYDEQSVLSKPRAELSVSSFGGGGGVLSLADEQDEGYAMLTANSFNGASLYLPGLTLRGGREPKLQLNNKEKRPLAELGLDLNGEPGLTLFGQDASRRAAFALLDQEPTLQLIDKDEKLRAVLGYTQLKYPRTGSVEHRSPSSLVLFGEDGKVIWQVP